MIATWRPIDNCGPHELSELYEVSDDGRVRRTDSKEILKGSWLGHQLFLYKLIDKEGKVVRFIYGYVYEEVD